MEKKIMVKKAGNLAPDEIARFVQLANKFSSTVYIEQDDCHRVNAKSIMGMMGFLAGEGLEVTVRAEGADEEQAVEAIAECLTGKE